LVPHVELRQFDHDPCAANVAVSDWSIVFLCLLECVFSFYIVTDTPS